MRKERMLCRNPQSYNATFLYAQEAGVSEGDGQLRDHPAGKENGLVSTATSLCFQRLIVSLNQEDQSIFFSFFSFLLPSVLQIKIFSDPILV